MLEKYLEKSLAVDIETIDPSLKTKSCSWLDPNFKFLSVQVYDGIKAITFYTTTEFKEYLSTNQYNNLVFANGMYDVPRLKHLGVDLSNYTIHDVFLQAYLLDAHQEKISLDALGSKYLGKNKVGSSIVGELLLNYYGLSLPDESKLKTIKNILYLREYYFKHYNMNTIPTNDDDYLKIEEDIKFIVYVLFNFKELNITHDQIVAFHSSYSFILDELVLGKVVEDISLFDYLKTNGTGGYLKLRTLLNKEPSFKKLKDIDYAKLHSYYRILPREVSEVYGETDVILTYELHDKFLGLLDYAQYETNLLKHKVVNTTTEQYEREVSFFKGILNADSFKIYVDTEKLNSYVTNLVSIQQEIKNNQLVQDLENITTINLNADFVLTRNYSLPEIDELKRVQDNIGKITSYEIFSANDSLRQLCTLLDPDNILYSGKTGKVTVNSFAVSYLIDNTKSGVLKKVLTFYTEIVTLNKYNQYLTSLKEAIMYDEEGYPYVNTSYKVVKYTEESDSQGNKDATGGTKTGRIGSANPNIQQLPSEPITFSNGFILDYRGLFLAKKGYKWLSADYDQQELRLLAGLSEQKEIIGEYIADPKINYHNRTATIVKERTGKDVSKGIIKAINFASSYGGNHITIHKNLLKRGVNTTEEEVKEIYETILTTTRVILDARVTSLNSMNSSKLKNFYSRNFIIKSPAYLMNSPYFSPEVTALFSSLQSICMSLERNIQEKISITPLEKSKAILGAVNEYVENIYFLSMYKRYKTLTNKLSTEDYDKWISEVAYIMILDFGFVNKDNLSQENFVKAVFKTIKYYNWKERGQIKYEKMIDTNKLTSSLYYKLITHFINDFMNKLKDRVNIICQSSGADLLRGKIGEIQEKVFDRLGIPAWFMLVHDEVNFMIPENKCTNENIKLIKDFLEDTNFVIKLSVGCGIGNTYSEAKNNDLEI